MKVDYPITQSLDFFEDPYQVLDMAKNLEYIRLEGQAYPGLRTNLLSGINPDFFQYVAEKQLRLFYSDEEISEISYDAKMTFQKITSKDVVNGEGWIHQDLFSKLTTIIYLNPNTNEIGTDIWRPKIEWDLYEGDRPYERDFFNGGGDEKIYMDRWHARQNRYEKISSHNSIFNSCVYFDGRYSHSSSLNIPEGEERITLITFFEKIFHGNKSPILRTF